MRLFFILLILNITLVLGTLILLSAIGWQNDDRVADQKPILSAIDGLMNQGDCASALQEINKYIQPNGLGDFQMGLAGRKVSCLSRLKRPVEARELIDQLIATFPAARFLSEQQYFHDMQPDLYEDFGDMIADSGKANDELFSEPARPLDILKSVISSPRRLLGWIAVNLSVVILERRRASRTKV